MNYHTNRQNLFRVAFALLIVITILPLLWSCDNPTKKIKKIGIVNIVPALEFGVVGFKKGLTDLGYIEGKDVEYFYEGAAKGMDQIDSLVQNALDNKVDMLVAFGNLACLSAAKLTKGTDLPVVLAISNRPAKLGMVKSLESPGGNVTGIHNSGWVVKTFDWLMRIKPDVKKLYVPQNPKDISAVKMLEELKPAAKIKRVELIIKEAINLEEMKEACTNIPIDADAVFILPAELVLRTTSDAVKAARKTNIPVISCTYDTITIGTIIGFGFGMEDCGKHAAKITDKILKGAKPKDIPLENIEFFLGINLKEANKIGLEIPDYILQRADQILR